MCRRDTMLVQTFSMQGGGITLVARKAVFRVEPVQLAVDLVLQIAGVGRKPNRAAVGCLMSALRLLTSLKWADLRVTLLLVCLRMDSPVRFSFV